MVAQRQGTGLAIYMSRLRFPAGGFHVTQVNSALHPSVVANRVLASAGGKGRILTSVGWQVTQCDPIWHVSFP